MTVSIHTSQSAIWIEDSYSFTDYFNVVFTVPSGKIFIHDRAFEEIEDAEKLQERLERLEHFDPTDRPHWRYLRTAYGSPAWNTASEHDLQRADVEAEDGPGAYHAGHPGYLGGPYSG
jgi:hypothetical protein